MSKSWSPSTSAATWKGVLFKINAANTYAPAACTTTAAYVVVEYTIEEIAMVERDEAPMGEQQGFAVD